MDDQSLSQFPPLEGTTVVGFGHKCRNGKDTAAAFVQRTLPGQVQRFSFADQLKAVARITGGMTTKDAPLLQRLGDELRADDPLTLLRATYHAIAEAKPTVAVIPDVRYPNEVEMIHRMGGLVIDVRRFDVEPTAYGSMMRRVPYVAKDRPADHPTEVALDGYPYFDGVISADTGDLGAIALGVSAILRSHGLAGMPVVYVAGPFRGPDHWAIAENIRRAERLALEVWRAGAAALCPHANTAHFQNAAPDHLWLDGDIEMLRRCDAVIMTPDWERSTGATVEHAFAEAHGIPVFYTPGALALWIQAGLQRAAA